MLKLDWDSNEAILMRETIKLWVKSSVVVDLSGSWATQSLNYFIP